MELRAGYKQTEVGVIPEDWDVKSLKHLSPNQSVGVVINPSSYFDNNGTVPFLVGSNVGENDIDWESAKRITNVSNQILSASRLRAGDLVTVRVGEPGITAVIPPELDNCNCASMMIVRQHPTFNSHWLCYMMNSRIGRRQVELVQYGTAQKQFNISDAVNFLYPLPPLPEQQAIAAALSDVDALIGALDALIAKKRNIKQGAMQELLTGRKRLARFSGEWEEKRLSELINIPIQNGIFNAPTKKGRGAKLINVGDLYSAIPIDHKNLELLETSKVELERFRVANGDVFFTRSSLTPDGIAHCNIYENAEFENVVFDSHVIRVRANPNKIDPFFLFRFCTAQLARKYLVAHAKTTTMTTVDQRVIANLPISSPPLPEQHAIAETLSDMDAEIEGLERKRAKYQSVKQGMMQELLTGKTRLVGAL